MNYLERYRNGEYEQVWDDLKALGPAVREEPHYSQAREVAAETMRRVRRDCELIVARLHALGYIFGTYPDGSTDYFTEGPLVPLSDAKRADMSELEAEAGPLPLSLVAFWQEVGSVDFVGMHPEWPNGLDPLVVIPPDGALALLYEEDGDEGVEWFAGLAPDDVHKANESGGDPYGMALPNSSADFEFLNECHNLPFVSYLRMAILRWGGFPGLDRISAEFKPLGELVAGLEPF
jgi:hypothetical protein